MAHASHLPIVGVDLRSRLRRICNWVHGRPNLVLVLAVLGVLVFFLGKPFHMDDPLFIWAAKQIQAHPGDPYGFDVNWYGTVTRMAAVTMNPPLACFYLASVGALFGWSEVSLHGAFMLPALAAILGSYRLANHFCNRPLYAALAVFFTPVFLVSSTTVMCDVLMLALWVWAVTFWIEGLAWNNSRLLLGAVILATLAVWTKYYAVSLVPLLAIYAGMRERRLGWWCVWLLIPLVALVGYNWMSQRLYGQSPLVAAAEYVTLAQGGSQLLTSKAENCLIALGFTGGGLALVTFFLPLLWRWRHVSLGVVIASLISAELFSDGIVLKDYGPMVGSSRLWLGIQVTFWALGGIGILVLAINDIRSRRDAAAWLLGLWVLGTFVFAAGVNWTVNGRTILPMTPAVAILLIRRLEQEDLNWKCWRRGGAALGVVLGGGLAIWVAWTDLAVARAARVCAQVTFAKYGIPPARFWYQGHWGFQYYLQQLGAKALDAMRTPLQRGDIIATPDNNTNFTPLGPELVELRELITVPGPDFLTTMKGEVGAGFFAANRGPLPFAFGRIPVERVFVCVVAPANPPQAAAQGR